MAVTALSWVLVAVVVVVVVEMVVVVVVVAFLGEVSGVATVVKLPQWGTHATLQAAVSIPMLWARVRLVSSAWCSTGPTFVSPAP